MLPIRKHMGRLSCLPSCPRPFHLASQGPARTRGVWSIHPGRAAPAPRAGNEPGERSAPLLRVPETERERGISGGATPSLVAPFCTKHPRRAGGCRTVWQGRQRCQHLLCQHLHPSAQNPCSPRDDFGARVSPTPRATQQPTWGTGTAFFRSAF